MSSALHRNTPNASSKAQRQMQTSTARSTIMPMKNDDGDDGEQIAKRVLKTVEEFLEAVQLPPACSLSRPDRSDST